ncbi:MAG TPA: DoxX family protein [Candidatus Acidoferrales bacterium]|nr:DoxX family protein [Candidatus Acidoferrales bacterium]
MVTASLATEAAPPNKTALWVGRVLSALPVFVLFLSAFAKIKHPPEVTQQFTQKFGYPESLFVLLAVIEIACAVLYAIPRTAVLGAILVTGYLGGAIATHVRVGDPGFSTPLALGIFVWAGLFLRETRLRALLPLR